MNWSILNRHHNQPIEENAKTLGVWLDELHNFHFEVKPLTFEVRAFALVSSVNYVNPVSPVYWSLLKR